MGVYWLSWMMVQYFCFFDLTYRHHKRIVCLLLLNICIMDVYLIINSIEISYAYLLISLVLLFYLGQQKKTVVTLLLMSSLLFLYTGVQLILFIHPVWLFFSRYFLSCVLMTLVTILVIKENTERMLMLSMSMIIGELLYQLMRINLGHHVQLWDNQLLFYLYIALFFLYKLNLIKKQSSHPS